MADEDLIAWEMLYSDSSAPSEDWQPPEEWIPVPEPNQWEIYFLVDTSLPLVEFGFYCIDPSTGSVSEGNITVDWGDGAVETFEHGNWGGLDYPKHTYATGQTEQCLIKVTVEEHSCVLMKVYEFSNPPSGGKNLLIAKLGENIRLDLYDGTHTVGVFYDCKKLHYVKLNGSSKLSQFCFSYCTALKKVDLKNPLTTIPKGCFTGTYSFDINTLDISQVTEVEEAAFEYCCRINSVNMPMCTSLGSDCFASCHNLKNVNMPMCSSVGYYGFGQCRTLICVDMPMCTSLGRDCFYGDFNLSKAVFSEDCTFGSNCFKDCCNFYPRPDGSIN